MVTRFLVFVCWGLSSALPLRIIFTASLFSVCCGDVEIPSHPLLASTCWWGLCLQGDPLSLCFFTSLGGKPGSRVWTSLCLWPRGLCILSFVHIQPTGIIIFLMCAYFFQSISMALDGIYLSEATPARDCLYLDFKFIICILTWVVLHANDHVLIS